MKLTVRFLPQAAEDLQKFDNCDKRYILSAIEKLTSESLKNAANVYGNPLDKVSNDLLYVKLMGMDIRIVYQLIPYNDGLIILFVEFIKETLNKNIF